MNSDIKYSAILNLDKESLKQVLLEIYKLMYNVPIKYLNHIAFDLKELIHNIIKDILKSL